MGDKLAAKALAEEADVPTLPGSEDPTDADAVGYPLLVKAAGRGRRQGHAGRRSRRMLDEAVAAARREAASGFGDDRVFLERYLARARHIEIQILGDAHGEIVHLGERECSIQRRHQKILEESPSPRVDPALREAMGEAALRWPARSATSRPAPWSSCWTTTPASSSSSRSTRGCRSSTRSPRPSPASTWCASSCASRAASRWATARATSVSRARPSKRALYAEDPATDFLPATGTLVAFEPAAAPEVRWDSGVAAGSVIGTDFDPMLAKVIAYAPTRSEAAGRLALALERCHLGGVTTNRDFLVATLRTREFLAGDTTTDFIDRVDPPRSLEHSEAELERLARVAALWLQGANRAEAGVLAATPSGWRNARLPDQRVVFRCGEREIDVRYRRLRDGRFRLADGVHARIHSWSPDAIDVEVDSRRSRSRISRAGDRITLQGPRGDVELVREPRFEIPGTGDVSGGFVARMPGKVIDLRVAAGDSVQAGDTLLVLEAMKMEHPMTATEDGVVTEVLVGLGEQVEAGALMLVVEAAGAKSAGEEEKGES